MAFKKSCSIALLCLNLQIALSDTIPVTTRFGIVEGITLRPKNSQQMCHGFLGVPFAKPPIGNLRFHKPEPLEPWKEALQAVKTPPRCIQVPGIQFFDGPKGIPDSEDCLYLNIILPSKEIRPKYNYAVMVWIHGGGFVLGSGYEYDDEEICRNLVSRDVIVVKIQYRLHLYGFLASGDAASPGNYGLHDQILALKWIQENIASFGGDPSRITIFGESAGGASVSLLNHFPQAAPFYTQAIAQSGNLINPWTLSNKPMDSFHQLSAGLKCGTKKANNQEKVDCLRGKSAEEIEKAHVELFGTDMLPKRPKVPGKSYQGGGHGVLTDSFQWCPTIDNDLIPAGGWANMEPSKKPFITGTAEQEQLGFIMPSPMMKVVMSLSQPDDKFPVSEIEHDEDLTYSTIEDNIKEAIYMAINPLKGYTFDPVKAFNCKKGPIEKVAEFAYMTSQGSRDNKTLLGRQIVQLASDLMFNVPCVWDANEAKQRGAPTWLYSLEHFCNFEWTEDTKYKAATHASDLYLLFTHLLGAMPSKLDKNDSNMSDMMCTLWTDFAKYGTPTPDGSNISWPQFETLDNPVHLKLKLNPEVSNDYHRRTVPFWTSLFLRMVKMKKTKRNKEAKQKTEL